MTEHQVKTNPQYDAFISYSRVDKGFAENLEETLEEYRPPRDLNLPDRNLKVFRDEGDMTGTDYFHAIDRHLENASKLIVICSPAARDSVYVNDEINRFAKLRGARNIIPLIISGIPNNEVANQNKTEAAYPEALCTAMEMPLATDYRAFRLGKDKINRGVFEGAWFTVLANINDISRDVLEQRDKKRQIRQRRVRAGIVSTVIFSLVALAGIAWWQKGEAENQREDARRNLIEAKQQERLALNRLSKFLAVEARRQYDEQPSLALLLAVEAAKAAPTAAADGALRWLLSHDLGLPMRGQDAKVNDVVFSPDGRILASAGYDESVRLWDLKNMDSSPHILKVKDRIYSIAISPNGQILATGGDKLRLWDVGNQFSEPTVFWQHDLFSYAVAFNPGGNKFAAGCGDGQARIWDMERLNAQPSTLKVNDDSVSSVAFSPDSNTLAIGGIATIRLWELGSIDSLFKDIKGPPTSIIALKFDPKGRFLAAIGNTSNTIWLWDFKESKPQLQYLEGHTKRGSDIAFSANGRMLATGSSDRTVRLWNLNNFSTNARVLSGYDDYIHAIALSPDDGTIAVGGNANSLRIWNLHKPAIIPESLPVYGPKVTGLDFNAEGEILAVDSGIGAVALWNLNRVREGPQILSDDKGKNSILGFHPKGTILALKKVVDGAQKAWATEHIDVLSRIRKEQFSISALGLSPEGHLLASGGLDGTVKLWHLDNLNAEPLELVKKPVTVHTGLKVTGFAFIPERHILASASRDGFVRLWDLSSNNPQPIKLKHKSDVLAVTFSSKRQLLISGCSDGTILMWDLKDLSSPSVVLQGHEGGVTELALSPSGETLASAGWDETVRLWAMQDLSSPSRQLEGHKSEITALEFSPNGETLASGDADGHVLLWQVQLDALLQRACRYAGRNMTHDEWQLYMGEREDHVTCPDWPAPQDHK